MIRYFYLLFLCLVMCCFISCATPTRVEPPQSHQPPDDGTILLSWPLRGTLNLTRGFLTGLRPHQGLDLSAPRGTPVKAAHAGYVEYAGRDFSGYGNLVIINSGSGWATFYAHLHRIMTREGRSVKRGETIGTVGATGNARGVHLHFEMRYDKTPVDPIRYLP